MVKILFFESGHSKIRKAYGKATVDINEKLDLMEKEGIQLHASFILGGRTENHYTAECTLDIAKEIAERKNTTWILISPQLILPGSIDFKDLMQKPGMKAKYGNQDLIDIVDINRDFLYYFTTLTREEILDGIKDCFSSIRRKDIVLDIKGVIAEEEAYVKPERDYVK